MIFQYYIFYEISKGIKCICMRISTKYSDFVVSNTVQQCTIDIQTLISFPWFTLYTITLVKTSFQGI